MGVRAVNSGVKNTKLARCGYRVLEGEKRTATWIGGQKRFLCGLGANSGFIHSVDYELSTCDANPGSPFREEEFSRLTVSEFSKHTAQQTKWHTYPQVWHYFRGGLNRHTVPHTKRDERVHENG
jgi:hypothetical protein